MFNNFYLHKINITDVPTTILPDDSVMTNTACGTARPILDTTTAWVRIPQKHCQRAAKKHAFHENNVIISIYKRLTSLYFKFVCVANDKLVSVTLFGIARLVSLLRLPCLLIKTLYVTFLHLLPFTFLMTIFSHNFVNYKTRLALSNVIKTKKFECIYIDIYLIQIYHYSKR